MTERELIVKPIKYLFSIFIITVLLSSPVYAGIGYNFVSAYANKGNNFVGKELILNARGVATAFACDMPPTDLGTTQALCFNVPLYNMKTGAYVGTLLDKLADIVSADNGGLLATVTSTFQLTEWRRKPSLTTRVFGNIQPFLGNSSSSMTHLTGYIPTAGQSNILSGTGRFQHASGTARESGAVNLENFSGQPGDEVVFDLIWVIRLD